MKAAAISVLVLLLLSCFEDLIVEGVDRKAVVVCRSLKVAGIAQVDVEIRNEQSIMPLSDKYKLGMKLNGSAGWW